MPFPNCCFTFKSAKKLPKQKNTLPHSPFPTQPKPPSHVRQFNPLINLEAAFVPHRFALRGLCTPSNCAGGRLQYTPHGEDRGVLFPFAFRFAPDIRLSPVSLLGFLFFRFRFAPFLFLRFSLQFGFVLIWDFLLLLLHSSKCGTEGEKKKERKERFKEGRDGRVGKSPRGGEGVRREREVQRKTKKGQQKKNRWTRAGNKMKRRNTGI